MSVFIFIFRSISYLSVGSVIDEFEEELEVVEE